MNTAQVIASSNFYRSLLTQVDQMILDELEVPKLSCEMIPDIKPSKYGKKAIETLNAQGDGYGWTVEEASEFEFATQREGYNTIQQVQWYQLNKMLSQELEEYLQIPELEDFLKSIGGQAIAKKGASMATAMAQTRNRAFCDFMAAYQSSSQLFGDGVAMASATQPLIYGGTFSNLENAAPPDPDVIQSIIKAQNKWHAHSGRAAHVRTYAMFGGTDLEFLFRQILTAQGQLNSNFNNRNLIEAYQDEYMPGGYIVDQEYPNDNSWAIINDVPEATGLVCWMHKEFETDVRAHPTSHNMMYLSQAAWVFSLGLKHATHWIAGY